MSVRSYLAGLVAPEPLSVAELEELRRRAWLEKGAVLVIPGVDPLDEFQRQAVVNFASQRWGKRMRDRK